MFLPHERESLEVASEPTSLPSNLLSEEFSESVRNNRIRYGVTGIDHILASLRHYIGQNPIVRISTVQHSRSENYVRQSPILACLNRDTEKGLASPRVHHACDRFSPIER